MNCEIVGQILFIVCLAIFCWLAVVTEAFTKSSPHPQWVNKIIYFFGFRRRIYYANEFERTCGVLQEMMAAQTQQELSNIAWAEMERIKKPEDWWPAWINKLWDSYEKLAAKLESEGKGAPAVQHAKPVLKDGKPVGGCECPKCMAGGTSDNLCWR